MKPQRVIHWWAGYNNARGAKAVQKSFMLFLFTLIQICNENS